MGVLGFPFALPAVVKISKGYTIVKGGINAPLIIEGG